MIQLTGLILHIKTTWTEIRTTHQINNHQRVILFKCLMQQIMFKWGRNKNRLIDYNLLTRAALIVMDLSQQQIYASGLFKFDY